MLTPFDFHTHSVLCDGKNTLCEMADAAVKKGLCALGFSGHSYTSFDTSYCIKDEKEYLEQCRRLQSEYEGRLEILCGIERDFYADGQYPEFDYTIGSVHYVKAGKEYIPVDLKEGQQQAVNKYFDGDYLSFAEEYFKTVAKLCDVHPTDIVGHFDLIKIFNADGSLYSEDSKRYRQAALSAVQVLIEKDVLFEINTGGVFRGWRQDPYPSEFILEYIASHSGKITLNADSHQTDALAFGFSESVALAKKCGFNEIYKITRKGREKLKL